MKTPVVDITPEESYNIYYLKISDVSDYPTNWNITNATLEVTPPGFNKVAVAFTPRNVNVYKSFNLGITCDEDEECTPLPDGMYTVKYSIQPNSIYYTEKSFFRVNQISCLYGNAFLKVDMSACNNEQKIRDKRTLADIRMLIEGAIASGANCDSESASRYYNKAQQMLDNFHKSGCGCN